MHYLYIAASACVIVLTIMVLVTIIHSEIEARISQARRRSIRHLIADILCIAGLGLLALGLYHTLTDTDISSLGPPLNLEPEERPLCRIYLSAPTSQPTTLTPGAKSLPASQKSRSNGSRSSKR